MRMNHSFTIIHFQLWYRLILGASRTENVNLWTSVAEKVTKAEFLGKWGENIIQDNDGRIT